MKFVSDPPVSIKVSKMKQRVRWQSPEIVERGIDQTRFAFADSEADQPDFSFLVVGDTGSGTHHRHHPQRKIAEMMLSHHDSCRFMLHTGDVVYLVGSSEYYPDNFVKPYREFLVNGDQTDHIPYDQMVFKLPILPVLGNHDYYDLPLIYGILAQVTWPIRRVFRSTLDLDVGWHGSEQGRAYAKAFLDCLQLLNRNELGPHLDRHYRATTDSGRCLLYEPGQFTRLPNRYYTFRNGGIDFFALDSNTFNVPLPIPKTKEGDRTRRHLEKRRDELERERLELLMQEMQLNRDIPEEDEQVDDINAKLEQLEEVKIDIDKQLEADPNPTVDLEQLDWLRQRLIESWNNPEVRGRVIFFHHPPYVTEATKWHQAQTLAIRHRLRQVLDSVAETVGDLAKDRPLVDLILSGHAHCLEYIRTGETGHADSNLNWVVCGGSGFSLRRQREEGPDVTENFLNEQTEEQRVVARSHLFLGRNGHGSKKRRPYSFLRVDVKEGCPPKFVLRPYVAERFQHEWHTREVEPLEI